VYNRGFCGVRLEHVPPEQILALHAYYEALKAQSDAGTASFSLVGSRFAALLYAVVCL
jgi:hypothetical protein